MTLIRLALALLGLGMVIGGLCWAFSQLDLPATKNPGLRLTLAGAVLSLVILIWTLHSMALLLNGLP